jgi:hypothetical protein
MAQQHSITTIPERRALTAHERSLVRWLLEHGEPEAHAFLLQLADAIVIGRCSCGCATIDFGVGERHAPTTDPMGILADYIWRDHQSHVFGVFVFEREGLLAGLEVYSVDGLADATQLPQPEQLIPLAKAKV